MPRSTSRREVRQGFPCVPHALGSKGRFGLLTFHPVFRWIGCLASPGGRRARLSILLYHRVVPEFDPLLPGEPDADLFDIQMRTVASVFRVLPLDEAVERLFAGTLPARSACITFDDGYRNNFEIAYPILRRHGLTATFFIATGYLGGGRMFNDTVVETVRSLPPGPLDLDWIGLGTRTIGPRGSRSSLLSDFIAAVKTMPAHERDAASERLAGHELRAHLPTDLMMTPEQVRLLAQGGMSIGGHTVDHPILSALGREEAWLQIRRNRDELTSLVGSAPSTFAYPNGKPGDYAEEHVQMVERAGYSAAVSTTCAVATRHSNRYDLPRTGIWHRRPLRMAASLLLGARRADPLGVAQPG